MLPTPRMDLYQTMTKLTEQLQQMEDQVMQDCKEAVEGEGWTAMSTHLPALVVVCKLVVLVDDLFSVPAVAVILNLLA